MELSKQCVSLEIAKRLKELGVPQRSLFEYVNTEQGGEIHLLTTTSTFRSKDAFVSAFTVAELGELLPDEFFTAKYGDSFMYGFLPSFEYVQSKGEETTEADARGAMLIYLLEQKLITLP